jgi:hypothetical protein
MQVNICMCISDLRPTVFIDALAALPDLLELRGPRGQSRDEEMFVGPNEGITVTTGAENEVGSGVEVRDGAIEEAALFEGRQGCMVDEARSR